VAVVPIDLGKGAAAAGKEHSKQEGEDTFHHSTNIIKKERRSADLKI
jgi:hypothetical protein